MHIPTTLKHKPVLVAEDYGRIDGRTAYGSDAQGLSLGLAQWNDRGKVDISAKVWRHTGEKWSRQSEELPLHRVLDLAILACRAQLYFQEEAYRFPRGYDPEHPQVDRIGLQGDAMTVEVCTSSDHIDEDLRLFQDALARDGELLGERMRVLARLLGEAYRFPRGYDPEHPQVDRIGLQGDAMTVEVCTSSDHIDEDLRLFQDALARDGELLGERMRVLARLLGELGCRG